MRRHPTDTVSLIAGLFFVTFAALWFVNDTHSLSPQLNGLVFAGVFVLAGLIGLVRALRRPRSEETDTS